MLTHPAKYKRKGQHKNYRRTNASQPELLEEPMMLPRCHCTSPEQRTGKALPKTGLTQTLSHETASNNGRVAGRKLTGHCAIIIIAPAFTGRGGLCCWSEELSRVVVVVPGGPPLCQSGNLVAEVWQTLTFSLSGNRITLVSSREAVILILLCQNRKNNDFQFQMYNFRARKMECIEEAICKAVRYRKFNSLVTETFQLARTQAEQVLKRGKTPFPVVVKDCYMYAASPTFPLLSRICRHSVVWSAVFFNKVLWKSSRAFGFSLRIFRPSGFWMPFHAVRNYSRLFVPAHLPQLHDLLSLSCMTSWLRQLMTSYWLSPSCLTSWVACNCIISWSLHNCITFRIPCDYIIAPGGLAYRDLVEINCTCFPFTSALF